ncbi:MAG: FAD-dependent oxidoreductase [Ruminococcaceae bacterium]|nr:FAD-dependent oxidoreductase [Oscillospiraceae bacterium]
MLNESVFRNVELPSFEGLSSDKTTDVLIIGAGIAGILTAYFLDSAGVDYILVEKDRICSHTTGNTTAKITLQHGLIYSKILKSSGKEETQKYLLANKKALENYRELCKNIDCDFSAQDNFVYSTVSRKKLEDEIKALEIIGQPAEFCEKIPLPVKTVGAVFIRDQAQFHPLKFIKEISKNLNILENTFVKEIRGTTAICEKGKIKAKRVVVTTHFPFINKHGSYFLKLYQHRSYEIALKTSEKISGMYVDEDKKGLSFRMADDLFLLGGGGHRTGKKGGSYSELFAFAKENYPKAEILNKWAAQDCISLDSVPYIGQYSASTPNLYVITGFNKWGMTSSMVAADILCSLLTEKTPEYASVFSPSRSILKPQLALNGLETGLNMLTPTTKRCSHLGCALKWNKAEHSWDCACHGSRFTENGKCLDNPANTDLN